ncbi:hypothetical protein J3704_004148 [Salmonella enterica subsp. diarizonae serovar 61:z52:z53]|uniref:type IV pilus modification PilV family protein n=1 Tax=Salmonella enterica TaxID=28901 RepID=UPI0009AC42E6|nr:hypothetical protein [Salmonella enterica]EDL8432149.1 hypothetical protein [Salmonella enterica subsp. diarizonae]EHG6069906.1 hypothetical protein [Salmonella enterica subsp. diarizonae serovar 61:z52:z53]EHG6221090.1 hypothetical protein [Salmonella enterica subsp. diarizonae serovar 61:z52:z53]EJS8541133.1 hypothetical protein [Salmonella enterica]EJS8566987.1 hypothetical protein [Salmonella enterica]
MVGYCSALFLLLVYFIIYHMSFFMRNSISNHQQGFSLLETTVAMMVTVSLIGLGATLYNHHSDSLNIKKSADVFGIASDSYFRYLHDSKSKLSDICQVLAVNQTGVYENIALKRVDSGRCSIALETPSQSEGLKAFMPDGMVFPSSILSGYAITGRGMLELKNKGNGQPKITSLLIAGLKGTNIKDTVALAKMANEYGVGFGYVVLRNGKVDIKGDGGLFSVPDITSMAQVKSLPAGVFFALHLNDGYLTLPDADDRYLVRNYVPNHAELNQMTTDIDIGNNNIKTKSKKGAMGFYGKDVQIKLDSPTDSSYVYSDRIGLHDKDKKSNTTLFANRLQFSQTTGDDKWGVNRFNVAISSNKNARADFTLEANSLTGFPDGFYFNSSVNVDGRMKSNSLTTSMLNMTNSYIDEGNSCSLNDVGKIVKSTSGEYLVCKYLAPTPRYLNEMSGKFIKHLTDSNGKDVYFVYLEKSGDMDGYFLSSSYQWVYLQPDMANRENIFILWKNSSLNLRDTGGLIGHNHRMNKTIQLPSWYPYGHVEVCAYSTLPWRVSSEKNVFAGELLKFTDSILDSIANKRPIVVEHNNMDYERHCSSLYPGQYYTDMIGFNTVRDTYDFGYGKEEYIFALTIRYKGMHTPDFMRDNNGKAHSLDFF